MIYCNRCGAKSEDNMRFCSRCGARLDSRNTVSEEQSGQKLTALPPAKETQKTQGAQKTQKTPTSHPSNPRDSLRRETQRTAEGIQRLFVYKDESFRYREDDRRENRFVALLSYLHILVLVPLLSMQESPYVQYHVRCGLSLLFWQLVCEAISHLLVSLFGMIPIVNIFVWTVVAVANLFLWGVAAFGIAGAVRGKARISTALEKYHLFRTTEKKHKR